VLISLDDAVARLKQGDLVALPTETVYGLAGLALQAITVRKIFKLKGRPSTNPLIVHVNDLSEAENIASFNDLSKRVCEIFWPGPITIVLPKKDLIPLEVTAGNQTVALRAPNHPIFREILQRLKQPLAAPSANPSNRTSPTTAAHIAELFGDKAPPTVDGGACIVGLESTVLDLTNDKPTILRPGMITRNDLQLALGEEVLQGHHLIQRMNKSGQTAGDQSPGMSDCHYAPKTPLFLHASTKELLESEQLSRKDLIIVCTAEEKKIIEQKKFPCMALSIYGNGKEIAHNLYSVLIKADKKKSRKLHLVFSLNPKGQNRAVFDRLDKASVRSNIKIT
jgi:L-threonylcarbamoyladenylate synthase